MVNDINVGKPDFHSRAEWSQQSNKKKSRHFCILCVNNQFFFQNWLSHQMRKWMRNYPKENLCGRDTTGKYLTYQTKVVLETKNFEYNRSVLISTAFKCDLLFIIYNLPVI